MVKKQINFRLSEREYKRVVRYRRMLSFYIDDDLSLTQLHKLAFDALQKELRDLFGSPDESGLKDIKEKVRVNTEGIYPSE